VKRSIRVVPVPRYLVVANQTLGSTELRQKIRKRSKQTRRQQQRNQELSREELRLARESQIADRFTRVVEQLGSDALDLHLGGIYARDAWDLAAARRGAVVTHRRAAQRADAVVTNLARVPGAVAGMSTGITDRATTSRA
jgi:hypothetical protein